MRPSAPLLGRLRKIPLTTKQVSKGWHYADYNKVGLLGSWEKGKGFIPDYSKIRTFKMPKDSVWEGHEYKMAWNGPELKPFVTTKKSAKYDYLGNDKYEVPPEKLTGKTYLEIWKEAGGHDVPEQDAGSAVVQAEPHTTSEAKR
ncbi:hypothetical protein K491DRAFT_719937 [Lophiostoma macrostomum CBS 122681]|uniref:Uncharacterized protein n=1 Tax=Lophiostoma macrostomum CBS 122681 TaxID=1314788 RepID=A0A6A6SWD5_9PLEO|nr:hypothetical protein K491DRAFT_719937 [Lophiostoma macrostomum CBS 122681]